MSLYQKLQEAKSEEDVRDLDIKVRERLKLNRPDVGWYQIRMALQALNVGRPTDFGPFKTAYEVLTQKLRPELYRKGFLKS